VHVHTAAAATTAGTNSLAQQQQPGEGLLHLLLRSRLPDVLSLPSYRSSTRLRVPRVTASHEKPGQRRRVLVLAGVVLLGAHVV
jgi:hypothetical protein